MSGSPWSAVSSCTEACVTGNSPQTGPGRALTLRRYAALAATLAGTAAAGRRLGAAEEVRRRARLLLADLGVTLLCEADGLAVPVPGAGTGTLVVANHISWLDVLALLAVQPATVLAKREVGQWPVVGTLARRAGTRFIDRGRPRDLPVTVRELGVLLRSGETVIVFPEGTTWCSAPGGPFRRATFQAALDAGAPVRPVTVSYSCRGGPSTLPAFVGEGSFAASLRRVAAARGLTVRVTAHPALQPSGHDRRSLAALAHAAVSGAARSPVGG
ncbi:lysophospholipid acyltransferase family protein [Streptomyces sp. NPDC049040]|uniref:lysophospholipid acyltransferase family protein n=1 Tax=Streptomyces sp. NPDC049040 TaxID=3365593 RepID=UPI00371F94E8